MTSIKEDGEKARGMIAEMQKIPLREEKLAACIEDIEHIEHIYQSNPKNGTIREVMANGVRFLYKSYLCQLSPEESIYIVVSLGVRDRHDNKPTMYGDAWVRTEFLDAHPADDGKPLFSREFILGRFQVGVKQDKELVTFLSSKDGIDEHLEYIDEAIGLVARSLHMGRAHSTPGVE
jgi:hypothetical protein